ncbi:MAG: phage tail sheath family protein [Ktedonobacteraceae bacterium]
MPEYLAPGVYIEEVSFRSKSIEGVSTSTAGFVGPTLFGPISGEPELLTSFADFERMYGGLYDLAIAGQPTTNYLAHAVRAFFEEGGQRLYVSRVFHFDGGFQADNDGIPPAAGPYAMLRNLDNPEYNAGSLPGVQPLRLVARFPGAMGNMRVTFTLKVGANALITSNAIPAAPPTLTRIQSYDLVHVGTVQYSSPPGHRITGWASQGGADGLFLAYWNAPQRRWELRDGLGGNPTLLDTLPPDTQIRPITVLVEVARPAVNNLGAPGFDVPTLLGEFSFDPRSINGLTRTFIRRPTLHLQALTSPFSIEQPGGFVVTGNDAQDDALPLDLARELLGQTVLDTLLLNSAQVNERRINYTLTGGSDGDQLPTLEDYQGDEVNFHDFIGDPLQEPKNGLLAFEGVEDISIVAAPGYSAQTVADDVFAIQGAVIDHCEKMRYRIAVLDTPPNNLVSDALDFRNQRSSKYAALYYPWITILDPLTNTRLNLPPSGFVAGIYARNDVNRSVSKAPANEVVRLAIDFEQRINKAQQEVLNPDGVNCFRFFSGHGFLLWGARTISDDPEWKYVNLRRYFAYLEHSIDRGTQWVVFENNSQQLWTNVRHTVEDFLYNEWKMGSLMGTKPEEAFFVRCDLTTMTQNDLDNGRLVCLIGVAAVRPAEFVIFRIGQWTANTSNR